MPRTGAVAPDPCVSCGVGRAEGARFWSFPGSDEGPACTGGRGAGGAIWKGAGAAGAEPCVGVRAAGAGAVGVAFMSKGAAEGEAAGAGGCAGAAPGAGAIGLSGDMLKGAGWASAGPAAKTPSARRRENGNARNSASIS